MRRSLSRRAFLRGLALAAASSTAAVSAPALAAGLGAAIKICRGCGAPNPGSALFCGHCFGAFPAKLAIDQSRPLPVVIRGGARP